MDPVGSVQNLELQELKGKIFQDKDLAWERWLHIFFVRFPKILIMNDLGSLERTGSGQNLEPQGLTGKIFRDKDLAPSRSPFRELAMENWLGEPLRM